ncbi:MAG: ankyrin repeat domain-containing protein [Flavobacterium sp.]|uniref:ankyrin repeat domain-containing protein n=1 Tax=Flavobacterium sp. TaxID=239 RepID=UPI001213CF42|nr:ankyrin repeat domain-containing protein [Flavobacterium sp.]RZJ67749.1 MAG: ankyrin repeat domain-containing protein [Flavobacterium sp.]
MKLLNLFSKNKSSWLNETDELSLFANDIHSDTFFSEVEKLNDVNKKFQKGFNLLHLACEYHNLKLATRLLERNIHVDDKNKFGNTPLWIAVFNSKGRYELVDLLLSFNADPNSVNNAGNSPIKFAETIGDETLIRKLRDSAR